MSNYFKISKENSLRFADRADTTIKNDYNSLSCEDLNEFKYLEKQLYLVEDTVKTQFRSNYDTNDVKITDESGSDTSLTVTKKTTNLGRDYSLDGQYYNYKGGGTITGIYFNTGDVYDYTDPATQTVIGTHTLNGSLPEFAIIGQDVEIVGVGTFEIERIIYDEDVDSNVILVTNAYSGADTAIQIQSEYDIQPYEVYEFDVDCSGLLDLHYVTISLTKVAAADITFRSELIDVQTEHEGTVKIVYYNEENNEIYYSTGIQNLLRIKLLKKVASSPIENEIIITDDTVKKIGFTTNDEYNDFLFDTQTVELMRKLKAALSSDIVIINNEGYISDGTLEEENVENTNLYTLNAKMIKTGINYYTRISNDGFNYTLSTNI